MAPPRERAARLLRDAPRVRHDAPRGAPRAGPAAEEPDAGGGEPGVGEGGASCGGGVVSREGSGVLHDREAAARDRTGMPADAPGVPGDGPGVPRGEEGLGLSRPGDTDSAHEPGAPVEPDGAAPTSPGGPRLRPRVRLALRERLPLWWQTRCGVEPRALAALGLVLLAVTGFGVYHFWAGRPQTVRAPEVEPPRAAPTEPGPPMGAGPTAAAGPGRTVVVDVAGRVRDPGVHRLPTGSRVADALRAAGGVRPDTDVSGLNRARTLTDGEQIVVGGTPAPVPAPPGGPAVPQPGGAPTPGSAPVSLNSATAEQLDALPGVGPVLAQHILDYRTRHGGFRSVDELRDVNGIGDQRFADLSPLVRP
ncbi:helix-hairpin-helix domain-containing protein [Streptomyces sp. LX-29]|nr:helix-hairpin-helix domain-containing protein [Streptomyces sp. LX-29]WFB11795.1 helix-hairpin-helix domain-containing protein [Streptomyces sp. LX-29]